MAERPPEGSRASTNTLNHPSERGSGLQQRIKSLHCNGRVSEAGHKSPHRVVSPLRLPLPLFLNSQGFLDSCPQVQLPLLKDVFRVQREDVFRVQRDVLLGRLKQLDDLKLRQSDRLPLNPHLHAGLVVVEGVKDQSLIGQPPFFEPDSVRMLHLACAALFMNVLGDSSQKSCELMI